MIKADDWIAAVLPLIAEGKSVKIRPTGWSMVPFIVGERDQVEVKAFNPVLKRGDIVLYRRDNGQYVLHRIYKVRDEDFYMLGDSQNIIEGPVKREQIVAQSRYYYKKGKRKDNDSLSMRVKYTIWFWVRPFRNQLIRLNNIKRKLFRKE